MTPNAPTWGEIEAFLQADGWVRIPGQSRGGRAEKHIFYEKFLLDRRVLQTHISHSRNGRPSPGRFALILREQLEISRDQFWTALKRGEPAERPATVDAPIQVEHEAWVVAVLVRDLHMSAAEIASLTIEEARARVTELWSQPKD